MTNANQPITVPPSKELEERLTQCVKETRVLRRLLKVSRHAESLQFSSRPSGQADTQIPPKSERFSKSAANSAAIIDSDLQAVNEAWPKLPPALRAGIIAMVKAAGNGEGR